MLDLNIRIDGDDLELMHVLYSGYGSTPSVDENMKIMIRSLLRDVCEAVNLREMSAMSGAMRWPWSQEFKVVSSLPRGL